MKSIEAVHLSKSYPSRANKRETFHAVRDLDFHIEAGEVVAFLGPNGAGKSTTIKMLSGILTPTLGESRIMGLPAGSKEASRQLGLVFGTRSQLYMHMTVYESLDLISEIYYVTGPKKKSRIHQLAELFQIEPYLKARVRTLSLGERMRCELVAALIHRPRVLLADEPTIGLDIVAKNKLRELIRSWQQEEQTTLLLTSHDLSDVEALCRRCILIDHGQKQYDGPLAGLKGELSGVRRLQITVGNSKTEALRTEPRIQCQSGSESFIHKYEVHTATIPMTETISRLSQHYGEALQDLQIFEVSLEEVLSARFSSGRAVGVSR